MPMSMDDNEVRTRYNASVLAGTIGLAAVIIIGMASVVIVWAAVAAVRTP